MRQISLAIVTVVAFSFPAMAQIHKMPEPSKTVQMPHQSRRSTAKNMTKRPQKQLARNKPKETGGNNEMQAIQFINPMRLSRSQVRQVQRMLDKKVFNARKVDRNWGPETAAAMRRFQRHVEIDAHGHLTRKTLAWLDVNWARSHEQPSTAGYDGNDNQGMSRPKQPATTGSGSPSGGHSKKSY